MSTLVHTLPETQTQAAERERGEEAPEKAQGEGAAGARARRSAAPARTRVPAGPPPLEASRPHLSVGSLPSGQRSHLCSRVGTRLCKAARHTAVRAQALAGNPLSRSRLPVKRPITVLMTPRSRVLQNKRPGRPVVWKSSPAALHPKLPLPSSVTRRP